MIVITIAYFLNRMLAYRCEDIYKRLEPQELFTRKEMEQTLQLDVSCHAGYDDVNAHSPSDV